MKSYNAAIVGRGYIGLTNSLLLVQHNDVLALDIALEKVDMIKGKVSLFEDKMYMHDLFCKDS